MTKILVIGGGITSAATSAFLAEKVVGKNVQVTIWDKARGAGGRMSTSRSSGNPDCIADLGAQYVTVTPEYAIKHREIHQDLIDSNVIKPLEARVEGLKSKDGTTDYVTSAAGMSSIVKHFFKKSGLAVNFSHHINHISISSDNKIQVSTQNGKNETFDSALMTMPVPQILQLPGMEAILSNSLTENLAKVQYSSRYALALFYDNYEAQIQLNQSIHDTGAHYISDDPIFCYAAIDGLKKGLKSPTSVVFHTKVPWGIKHLETPIPDVEKILVAHYQNRYPDWPAPVSVKCLRWRYSQVSTPFHGCPGAVILNEKPLLIAAGDGFVHRSGLDACIESAQKACDILYSRL